MEENDRPRLALGRRRTAAALLPSCGRARAGLALLAVSGLSHEARAHGARIRGTSFGPPRGQGDLVNSTVAGDYPAPLLMIPETGTSRTGRSAVSSGQMPTTDGRLVNTSCHPDVHAIAAAHLRGRGSEASTASGDSLDHKLESNITSRVPRALGVQPDYLEPRVFFLFLTIAGIERMDLWEAFFTGVNRSRYRALIHCKHEHVCDLSLTIRNRNGFDLGQVGTVSSYYCSDLVTPMVQLLKAAIAESVSPNDKFVFISGTTLPVKPFNFVYSALTANVDSDFCISPASTWVKLRFGSLGNRRTALLVKHSQWVVLTRDMATTMAQRWSSVGTRRGVWSVSVVSQGGQPARKAEIHGKVGLCTDEWAFFATVYGTIIDNGQPKVELPGFAGDRLRIRDGADNQGVCRTFDYWRSDSPQDASFMKELLDPGTRLSCYPSCHGSHPAEFERISDQGAAVLRRSPYLFARKFRRNVMPLDRFQRVILNTSPPYL